MAEHKNSVYRKISEDISAKIESGAYAAGAMLEPERKLMEIYGVERTTIRRALDILAREGKIVKKTGLGSFVTDGNSVPVYKEKAVPVKAEKPAKRKSNVQITSVNDYALGAQTIFSELAEAGHKKIMCTGKADELFAAIAGEAAKLGLYDADLFVTVDERNTADYMFERVWSSIRSSKPTAVIAATAEVAHKIIERAERMRISIPEELTVVALNTSRASGVCGCIYNGTQEEKKVLDAVSEVSVSVTPVFVQGETFAEAKSGRGGSGSMSAYLL